MWTYIVAAARGIARPPAHKNNTTADPDDIHTYNDNYNHRVFTVPRERSGTSGINITSNSCDLQNKVHSPLSVILNNVPEREYPQSEDLMEPGEEVANDQARNKNWLRKQLSRLTRSLRCRISRQGRTISPDWFLDKFVTTTFEDPEEPLYQAKRFCGLKMAIDNTLPSHYHWLAVVSLAILYNIVFVIGRAVFWQLDNLTPALWYTLDYLCDGIYLVDTIIHAHEGVPKKGRDNKERKNYVQFAASTAAALSGRA